jgi:hypothetical protein
MVDQDHQRIGIKKGQDEQQMDKLHHLLYASVSNLDPATASEEVERIVEQSRPRNLQRDITGGLIFSGVRFAQYLEGPRCHLIKLSEEIRADPRHQQVTILLHEPIDERALEEWSMRYAGPSLYVDRHIKTVIGVDTTTERAKRNILRLEQLIIQFSKVA